MGASQVQALRGGTARSGPAAGGAHSGASSQLAAPGSPFAVGITAASSPGMGSSRTCLAGGERKEGLAPGQGFHLVVSAQAADLEERSQNASFFCSHRCFGKSPMWAYWYVVSGPAFKKLYTKKLVWSPEYISTGRWGDRVLFYARITF